MLLHKLLEMASLGTKKMYWLVINKKGAQTTC